MSDEDEPSSSADKRQFIAEYDKRGTASCKRCKQKIAKGSFRLGKLAANPFSDSGGEMKQWFHPSCLFDSFTHARASSAKITKMDDLSGYEQLQAPEKELMEKLITGHSNKHSAKTTSASPKKATASKINTFFPSTPSPVKKLGSDVASSSNVNSCPDNMFSSFCNLCTRIAAESSYKAKSAILEEFVFRRGASGKHPFCGDLYVLIRLLLPGEKGLDRVYNMNNKQIIKIFAEIFGEDPETILSATNEHGDISVVVGDFYSKSNKVRAEKTSTLSLMEVDKFLDSMTELTKYDDQLAALRKLIRNCGVTELQYVIRLLKKDLRMNAKARHVLDALGQTAYDAFQMSRDLKAICLHVQKAKSPDGSPVSKPNHAITATVLTPVQPMLAEACRSVEYALEKCPGGMFAEIKYDGERVQVHKNGNLFNYFSRSLKPVLQHKVSYLSEAIPKAFPKATDLILDGEIVLVDTTTHLPLPFGTLGVHKKAAFKTAQVCIFIFDVLHMNGSNLMNKTLLERREALRNALTEIPDRVVLSEVHRISKAAELKNLLEHVFTEGLEGLVLKPLDSRYEPGKRHWLKMKKDYLEDGAMADAADLLVLGAYFGTGNKGGLMSVFLMGVYDAHTNKFLTVTKCGNGFDDNTLNRLQKELDMIRINKDSSKVPDWLMVKASVIPDFVIRDPRKAPVWEVTGAEFSKAEVHTADGISIRFPRVTKVRDDKDWKSATSLEELKILCKNSRQQAPKLHPHEKASPSTSEPSAKKDDKKIIQKAISPDASAAKRKLFKEEAKDVKSEKVSTASSGNTGSTKANVELESESPKKKSKGESPKNESKGESPKNETLEWNPSDIFTGCNFYFDKTSIKDSKMFSELSRCVIAHAAASVCHHPSDAKITHVVVADNCNTPPVSVSATAKCVHLSWVAACVKAKSLVDTTSYVIH